MTKARIDQDPEEDSELEQILASGLTEKTEFEAVAEQIHKATPSHSNINPWEKSACFRCNGIFPEIGMKEENPVSMFLELNKSQGGWATQKFVESVGGINNQRSGGMFGALRDKLFTPNNGGGGGQQ